jgi:prepilin-type N-terminal cleavage/methylation domain-containing protein
MVDFNRAGFTLMELLLTLGILSILMSVIIGAINPGKRIGAARDAVRKNDLGALARAIEAYWTTHGATLPDAGQTRTSTVANGGSPTNADGKGWIWADLTAEMKTIPVDPLNNGSHWYQYYGDGAVGSNRFKLQTPVEADFDAAKNDGGAFDNLYEAGTDKSLTPP